MSKAIEELEDHLVVAKRKVIDIQRGIDANIQNIVDCRKNQVKALSDVEDLERSLSILRENAK